MHISRLNLKKVADNLWCSTHTKGLFPYKILTYGVASDPAIFQNIMENILADIPGTGVHLDDIVISGKTNAALDANVEEVLNRLYEKSLRLKFRKSKFG